MKKLKLAVCSLLLSFSALAEIPKDFKVYTGGAGTAVPFCNKLIDEYNSLYNTNATLVIKPGASTLIAIREMLADKKFSILCFTGLGENVFNPHLFPQYKKEHEGLTSVAATNDSPTLFYTGVNSPYKDLADLVANKKNLTIGSHSAFGRTIGELITKALPDTVHVNYKTAREAIPSLVDGTLDLYIDAGGLVTAADAGIIKSLGHFNASKNAKWPDMSKHFPEAASFKSFTIISTNVTNDKNDILKFNENLKEVMKSEVIIAEITSVFGVPNFKSVEETNKQLDAVKKLYNKQYNK
jgi:tripartite-type tricarboxylate transporter receptor subunit TctC